MTRRSTMLPLLLVLGACHHAASGSAPVAPAVHGDPIDAARRALESWRQAYEVESYDALAALYAHERNVVVVRQGVATVGWDAIAPTLKSLLGAKEIRVHIHDVQIATPGVGAAVITAGMDREVSDGVTTISERGIVTLVLRQEHESWLVVAEHYSFPPSAP